MNKMEVQLGVSNRHVHLCRKDMDQLFGKDVDLHEMKALKQPGQYASEETITIEGAKGEIGRVRVLGPLRSVSQVEISVTDSFVLGVPALVRDSGDIEGTPGLVLIGPKGRVELDKGVIVAARHLHLHTDEAKAFGVKDKDYVSAETTDQMRPMVYGHVLVRVNDAYSKELHLDIDEANAGLLKSGMMVNVSK